LVRKPSARCSQYSRGVDENAPLASTALTRTAAPIYLGSGRPDYPAAHSENGRERRVDVDRSLAADYIDDHIENLADAIELALTKGQPGEAYFILDEGGRSMKVMLSGLAATVGVVLPDRPIPYWLADTIAAVSGGVWRLFRLSSKAPITWHAAMVMARDCILIGTNAEKELGYRPRVTVERGLADLA
jgi:nucleoside-diphosphate-sugar epimerase